MFSPLSRCLLINPLLCGLPGTGKYKLPHDNHFHVCMFYLINTNPGDILKQSTINSAAIFYLNEKTNTKLNCFPVMKEFKILEGVYCSKHLISRIIQ